MTGGSMTIHVTPLRGMPHWERLRHHQETDCSAWPQTNRNHVSDQQAQRHEDVAAYDETSLEVEYL